MVSDYLMAIGAFCATIGGLKIFQKWILRKIEQRSKKTKNKWDDFIIKIIKEVGWSFYILLPLYVAFQFLEVPEILDKFIYYGVLIVIVYYVVRSIQKLIDYSAQRFIEKKSQKDIDPGVVNIFKTILKMSLWIVAILLILSNAGYDISALIASLGIGGIAVAIALQNVLSDIFSYFSIHFDRPFRVGDFIIVGDDMGEVKKIGIKSTRLKSLWGEEIVISNAELTSQRINNYKKMEQRRIHFHFGVVYDTSVAKLRQILTIVREIFDHMELADLDRVHFKEFGDFQLQFEVAYYVKTGDYNKYMDIQQEINLQLKERFEAEGIAFAYPTQTLLVQKESS
jgi:small-conductance mechanosensitive channel